MYNYIELVKASTRLSAAAINYSTLKKCSDLCVQIHVFIIISSFPRFCFSFLRSYFQYDPDQSRLDMHQYYTNIHMILIGASLSKPVVVGSTPMAVV